MVTVEPGFNSEFYRRDCNWLVSSWSLSLDNKTATSMQVSWKNLSALLTQSVLHYITVIKSSDGSIVNGNILQGNTTSDVFYGLSPYMEYRLNVLGVNGNGKAYKSSEATGWTEESAPGSAPRNITFSEVTTTQFKVTWNTLPQRFHNGRLLGYRVYFRRSAYYPYPFNTSGVVTSSPNVTLALITGLGPAQRYDVSVAAFTAKGEGPRSSRYYVTTAQVLYGWNLTVVKTTFSSILIRWVNLTSLLNRKVGQYVVFLNRRNKSVAFHQVVNGDQLTAEISGLTHLTNYTVEVVGIDTLRKPYKTPSEAIMTANRKSLRLVGGSGSWEGRVEVLYNNIWGTVCDDSWDLRDAHVVCRQLGFARALSALGSSRFGAGRGQIWLDDVACSGNESSLVYCRHRRWGIHNCGHHEDASVICSREPSTSVPWKTCNFDYGLCNGWSQSRSDKFDWIRQRGSTSSSNTGPSSDHTTGNAYGIVKHIICNALCAEETDELHVLLRGGGGGGCLFY
ncbi:unnamed protein product [Porites evermanni]|uniref:Uncharacterized protein n=1 Tax=Porites evermanni TaxID=104178 RepID=A0ABN8QEE4_9CNID|nr:unnamed protein product [Porites evermanni]